MQIHCDLHLFFLLRHCVAQKSSSNSLAILRCLAISMVCL
ncbi:hypothetical protein HMPREF3226_01198 [Prevotella corporis]|uniref:Uncharacterized protein n=1 Tax=Prevotella corporis TaxID=28128 RepID=A0A133Q973_9BACT|nr:hypothetical protein HMPREF3226_01198 [Prevotella corporis]